MPPWLWAAVSICFGENLVCVLIPLAFVGQPEGDRWCFRDTELFLLAYQLSYIR